MNENLRAHVEESCLSRRPKTRRAVELKEELLANLTDRYNDSFAGNGRRRGSSDCDGQHRGY